METPANRKPAYLVSHFKYALRRYDIDADIGKTFACYSESFHSIPTIIEGVRAPTIFLKEHSSAERARKLGWFDETQEVFRVLRGKKKVGRPRKKVETK